MNKDQRKTKAHDMGKAAREKGFSRVSPFYNERLIVDGQLKDVTSEIDAEWFAGYDEAVPRQKTHKVGSQPMRHLTRP
jgi:hypothetical protein